MTLTLAIFQSNVKILSLVKKIIVFRYLGLHLEENYSGITLDQMNYSENLRQVASNYDNESNSKDLLQSKIGKVVMDEWSNKAR